MEQLAQTGTMPRDSRSRKGSSAIRGHCWVLQIFSRRDIKGATISTSSNITYAFPPVSLLEGASLFLDLDGTLVDLADRPDEITADDALRALLHALNSRLGGRLAIISGRSLAQLDDILGPLAQTIALSGSHGVEHRWAGIVDRPHRSGSLDLATRRLQGFAEKRAGMLVEEKSFGVALHYRRCPDAGSDAIEFARQVAQELDLVLQEGKLMIEIRMPGGDKGAAVRKLMERAALRGSKPVFIGDDRTDEPAFAAVVELGGSGILVGTPRDSGATYLLPDPASTRAWLAKGLK